MMARQGPQVESQTLWDQLQALARHLEPTYEALAAPVIHVEETRWPRLGSDAPAAGTVWDVASPTTAFYRILLGRLVEEGRHVLGDYRGTVVVDGYAVYEGARGTSRRGCGVCSGADPARGARRCGRCR